MALMGTGVADGEHRAVEAAQRAISSPLLEDASIHGARGVLINITGGSDMSLHEISEAAQIVQEAADPEANIIFGTVINRAQDQQVKVTVIATGFMHEHERPAFRHETASDSVAPATEAVDPAGAAEGARQERFLRPGPNESLAFDSNDDGFTPNFGKMKDDLDVPAFLRKQMD